MARGRSKEGEGLECTLNLSACDAHQKQTPMEVAKGAGWLGLVNNLLARMPVALEVTWEHIVGA